MNASKVFIVLSIFLATIFNSALAGEAVYANFFDKNGAVFSVGDDFVRVKDLAFPASRCGPAEPFYCIRSKSFIFAVPKDVSNSKQWVFDGAKYVVLVRQEKVIRGEVVSYFVIRQNWNGNYAEYAYSSDLGVMAIKGANGHELVNLDRCGFAVTTNKLGCALE